MQANVLRQSNHPPHKNEQLMSQAHRLKINQILNPYIQHQLPVSQNNARIPEIQPIDDPEPLAVDLEQHVYSLAGSGNKQ